jgi:hypothetical protein
MITLIIAHAFGAGSVRERPAGNVGGRRHELNIPPET